MRLKSNKDLPRIENRILLSLPKLELEKLLPDLKSIPLPLNKIVYQAGEQINSLYFINSGMASLMAANSEGGSVEIGVIGKEGILGMQVIMGATKAPYRSIVQIPSQALKITWDALKRHLSSSKALYGQLMRFYGVLHNQISQSVVCNRFHTSEQRLCRWLLTTARHMGRDEFPCTHESVSLMLGANRATVTAAFGSLKDSGSISQSRGLVRILDRKRMETAVCECYRANMRDLEELYRFQKQRKTPNRKTCCELM
jgi:CRP-like cAMP-binding protein